MKKFLLAIIVFNILSKTTFSQVIGMKLADSGRITVTTKTSCCTAGRTADLFKFDPDGGFVVGGEIGIGTIPASGQGYRTMWHPFKASFRSGYASTEWDDAQTGFFSWAGGANSTASGLYSFAFGDQNFATNTSSIVFGSTNKVYGAAGFSAGSANQVDSTFGVAFGSNSKSRNFASVALGYNLVAKGYAGTVVGMYNDSLLTVRDLPSSPTIPLFVVGNGSSNATRSNAMVVRKNGNVEIENLIIGGGNAISKQQTGTFTVGSSTTASKTISFTFPTAFSSTPKIVVTPKSEANTNYPDAFIVTTRSISTTAVTFNIIRIDASVGWSQILSLDWMAWE